jgi:hypothetical protein
MHTGHARLSRNEQECYEMFVLARDFQIKPWEADGSFTPKYEDLQTIMMMHRYEAEGREREQARQEAQQRLKSKMGQMQ